MRYPDNTDIYGVIIIKHVIKLHAVRVYVQLHRLQVLRRRWIDNCAVARVPLPPSRATCAALHFAISTAIYKSILSTGLRPFST